MLLRTITRFLIIALAILLAPVVAHAITGSTGGIDFLLSFCVLLGGVAIGTGEQWFSRPAAAPAPGQSLEIEHALLMEHLDKLHDALTDGSVYVPGKTGRNAVRAAGALLRQIRQRKAIAAASEE